MMRALRSQASKEKMNVLQREQQALAHAQLFAALQTLGALPLHHSEGTSRLKYAIGTAVRQADRWRWRVQNKKHDVWLGSLTDQQLELTAMVSPNGLGWLRLQYKVPGTRAYHEFRLLSLSRQPESTFDSGFLIAECSRVTATSEYFPGHQIVTIWRPASMHGQYVYWGRVSFGSLSRELYLHQELREDDSPPPERGRLVWAGAAV